LSAAAPSHDVAAEIMAAVDLGSNSFHMVLARFQHEQLSIVDRLREMVSLASGLTATGYLDDASQERALTCLRRFGQRLRDMHADQVRVVGTNTLRKARNSSAFLLAAEEALGQPVEVISGMEEARLIYLGVSHHTDSSPGNNLVIDIGGGSTELIIGRGHEPLRLESLYMGCVGLSKRFFGEGRLTRKRFTRARLAVSLELRPIMASFRQTGWQTAIGSSGTIRAVRHMVRELGLAESGITRESVEAVIEHMIAAGRVAKLSLPGLGADRAPVFAGGVAILAEALTALDIDRIGVSDGALREGLLYDMLGRRQHEDVRERSIRALQLRFHVDPAQAERVEATATMLFALVAPGWSLDPETDELLLRWAARLYEIGLDIAHSKYHEHGGYLLANADLPGFSRLEQQLLAKLVSHHRRKLDDLNLDVLPTGWREATFKLIVLLRLAVLLNRGRSPVDLPPLKVSCGAGSLSLRFGKRWLGHNPLTHADLLEEQAYLALRGFKLDVEPRKA
jgi:exopolyphosphatase / guanosine-5'-triphosphate,3'-diphosphate pyrophosphatase